MVQGWVRPADETGLLQFSSAGQQVETHISSTNEQRLHRLVASSSTEVPSDVTRPEISRADTRRETENGEADIEMSEIHISDVPGSDSSTQVAGADAGTNCLPL